MPTRHCRPSIGPRARRALVVALAIGLGACAAPEHPPLPTVDRVDLPRYMGTWYEIAMLPNRFQAACASDTQARYRLAGDRVEVVNTCLRADGSPESVRGHALVAEGSAGARLRVTFFWPFYGDYWVLALDPGYTAALVGAPDRRYAWVLSRTPTMDEKELQALLARAEALGFDRAAFRRTVQHGEAH